MRHPLVERTYSVDVSELDREGALSGCLMRFHFQGLTTRRFRAEFRGSRWPKERPHANHSP